MYGAYGHCLDPSFSPNTIRLLENNIAIAFVHARGGGELGYPWHQGGVRKKKWNGVGDTVAAIEYLRKFFPATTIALKGML